MEGAMEGSRFTRSATRTPRLVDLIAMRRPAPLSAKADDEREPSALRAVRQWRDEWRKKRYTRFKA
jgi:hypothetical protein